MKLNQTDIVIETSGDTDSNEFSIKTSAKAFQILSSGLYSNKPMAIVRELSANAADAHVLNGNQKKPFEVKIPNRLDNQFYVRDYGPGLSHAQVMKLYTTYFDSTKSESNDFIGGLGLGSKSPFSYTDSFTVVSIHNGERRLYSAYTGEQGIPKIVQLGEATKTSEPSGLQVGFPVKPSDYNAFGEEAQRILPWFTPTPTVLGTTINTTLKPTKKVGPLSVYSNIPVWSDGYGHANTFIKMGHVLYPMDWSFAGLDDTDDPLLNLLQHHRSTYVFEAPIGSIEVSASREGLQYDKNSVQSIKELLTKMGTEVITEIAKDITTIQKKYAPFEANARLGQVDSNMGLSYRSVGDTISKMKTADPSIKKALQSLRGIEFPKDHYTHLAIHQVYKHQRQAEEVVAGKVNGKDARIAFSSSPIVLEADTKGFIQAAKKLSDETPTEDYMKGSQYSYALVVSPKKGAKLDNLVYQAERDAFIKAIGEPNVRKTSEYVPPARAKLAATGGAYDPKEHVPGYSYPYEQSRWARRSLSRQSMALKDIDVWVPYKAQEHEFTIGGETISSHSMDLILTSLSQLAVQAGMPKLKLTAIPTTSVPKMERTGVAAQSLDTWLVKVLSKPTIQKKLGLLEPSLQLSNSNNHEQTYVADLIRKQKAFFNQFGPGWQKFTSASYEEKNSALLVAIKTTLGPLLKKEQLPLNPVDAINVSSVVSNLKQNMPMLMFTLAALRQEGRTLQHVKDDIEKYLRSRPSTDLDLT